MDSRSQSPLAKSSEVAGSTGVSEPARDYIAVDVSEGQELHSLPAEERGHSQKQGSDVATPTVKGNGGLQTIDRGAGQKATKAENLAESEIRSLLWLEDPQNQVWAKAHEAWEKKDLLFASRIDKKKKQSNSLKNEIYQLIGFYSVFQGVLLTAVAQSNLLHCHNWWTAFFLSLLASAVAIGGIIQKYQAILALELTIKNEESTRKECIVRGTRLIQKRQDFDFETDAPDGKYQVFDLTSLNLSAFIVLVSLLCFSDGLLLQLSSMVTTTFVNKTTIDFKLKEGNAGVYRDLAVLKGVAAKGEPSRPDGQFTVTLDVHATYREYTVVATGQKTKKSRVLVSSDMCQDNAVINIILNEKTQKYETKCEPRKKLSDHSQTSNNGQSRGGKLSNFLSFLKNLGK